MKSFFCIISLLAFLSCGQHGDARQQAGTTPNTAARNTSGNATRLATGTVLADVTFVQDTSQHYALYLPTSFSDQAQLPLLVFFDPSGVGSHPVSLYKELAEAYHVILAGSNNSRNGLAFDQTEQIAARLLTELTGLLHPDPQRIAVGGHSGGAKVALMHGATNPAVSTIIYSGATIPVTPNHPFMLIGFGGRQDMNYTDLVAFEWSLQQQQRLPHYFFEWPGPHEFPEAGVFRYAMEILTKGSVQQDASTHITITPAKLQEEQNIKQEYLNNFKLKDLGWWKDEVTRLNRNKDKDPMYNRLLGFISLACYSFVTRAFEDNNLISAYQSLELYKLADPTNKAIPGFEAELKKRQGIR